MIARIQRFMVQAERFYHWLDYYRAVQLDDWRGKKYAGERMSDFAERLYRLECGQP